VNHNFQSMQLSVGVKHQLLTVVLALLVVTSFTVPVRAQSPGLTTGTTWILKGTYNDYGQDLSCPKPCLNWYSETGSMTRKFVVTSVSDSVLDVAMTFDKNVSCVASGNWLPACSPPTWGSSHSLSYTISLPDLKIVSINGSNTEDTGHHRELAGAHAWFLINQAGLTDGGTLQMGWATPNSNLDSSTWPDVTYNVTTQPMNIHGVTLTAWNVSHTGQQIGWIYLLGSNNKRGVGPATNSYVYDPVYGTLIAETTHQNAIHSGAWGFNETYVSSEQLVSSTLSFESAQTTKATTQTVTSEVTQTSQVVTQSSASSQSSPTESLNMPQPPLQTATQPTATQSTNNTQLMLALVVLAAVVIGAVLLYTRRKGQTVKTAGKLEPEAKATTQEAAVQTEKPTPVKKNFCIECGAELPSASEFCNKCGTKQP